MFLVLLVSLAACHASGLDGDYVSDTAQNLLNAISNLELLMPLLLEHPAGGERDAASQYKARHDSLADVRDEAIQHKTRSNPRVPPSLGGAYSVDSKPSARPLPPLLKEGPFSDIPASAFHQEQNEPTGRINSSIKKDLSQFRASAPTEAVNACVWYFQGRASPPPHSAELLLQLCTELLEDSYIDETVHSHEPCDCGSSEPSPSVPLPSSLPVLRVASVSRSRDEVMESPIVDIVKAFLTKMSELSSGRRDSMLTDEDDFDPMGRQDDHDDAEWME